MRPDLVLLVLLAVLVPGCLIHSVEEKPKPPVALPDKFGDGSVDRDDAKQWWVHFNDRDLDRLVAQALDKNMSLAQAWARLDQGQAGRRAAMAGLFPRVDASFSAGRSKSPDRKFNLPPPAGEQTIAGSVSDSFNASLPVSYELDVWGRVRSGLFAAEQDAAALRADVETIALTLAANVTERWFDLVEQRATHKLLGRQLATAEAFLQIVTLQFRQGQAALSDIYQQRQQIQILRSQLVAVETRARLAQLELAVLLGKPPGTPIAVGRDDLPDPIALPAAGVPAKLLDRRPDLRAARHRVVAADYRVGMAIASRFPQLSLSGSVGFSSVDLASFFDSFVWSFLGSITASVWDGGRLSAEQARSEAALKERVHAYGQTLLEALLDVEGSLVREKQQRRVIAILQAQVLTAERTLDAARLRFESGVAGTFIPTLTALRSLEQAEQSLLASRRQLLSHRVQLYRALGGRWTRELRHPDDRKAGQDQKGRDKP